MATIAEVHARDAASNLIPVTVRAEAIAVLEVSSAASNSSSTFERFATIDVLEDKPVLISRTAFNIAAMSEVEAAVVLRLLSVLSKAAMEVSVGKRVLMLRMVFKMAEILKTAGATVSSPRDNLSWLVMDDCVGKADCSQIAAMAE